MLQNVRNMFAKNKKTNKEIFNEFTFVSLEDLKKHFENGIESDDSFQENKELINKIKRKILPNRKNIFILDDCCDITDILLTELKDYLEGINKLNKVNLLSLSGREAGFDMISIVCNHPEISIDYIITDIVFGCNKKINNKKIIVDGIDLLYLSKEVNPKVKFVIITGNMLDKSNLDNYFFSKKFSKYMGDSISNYIVFKDSSFNESIKKYAYMLIDL